MTNNIKFKDPWSYSIAMLKILVSFFTSSFFRFVIRAFASLASAIILVSSYLFFVSNQDKQRENKSESKKTKDKDPSDSQEEEKNDE